MDGWPGADTGRRRRQGTGVKGQIEQRTLGPTLLCSSTVTAHPCQRTGKVTAIPALLAACCQQLARDMGSSLDRPVASHTGVRGRSASLLTIVDSPHQVIVISGLSAVRDAFASPAGPAVLAGLEGIRGRLLRAGVLSHKSIQGLHRAIQASAGRSPTTQISARGTLERSFLHV